MNAPIGITLRIPRRSTNGIKAVCGSTLNPREITAMDCFLKPPPFGIVRQWLGGEIVERLLRHIKHNEPMFNESSVGYGKGKRVDHTRRRSSHLYINDLVDEIELNTKLHNVMPTIFERLGNTPFTPCKLEFQLAAHGDGGGVLRLHSLADHHEAPFIDIEPDFDTLVFFPSWFPHEVLPVLVPSGRFLDSRFAINCWIHRGKALPHRPSDRVATDPVARRRGD
jgi:hypothetical protein